MAGMAIPIHALKKRYILGGHSKRADRHKEEIQDVTSLCRIGRHVPMFGDCAKIDAAAKPRGPGGRLENVLEICGAGPHDQHGDGESPGHSGRDDTQEPLVEINQRVVNEEETVLD